MNIHLSILIPAYNYPEGIQKILSCLQVALPDGIEILISDDSRNEHVSQVVEGFSPHYRGKLRYTRNRPSLGAIINWNSLLEQASGEYILLLHHDEYPIGERFAQRALDLLRKFSEIDVFVLDCILRSAAGTDVRPHLPAIIRMLAFKYFPTYFFKRNVIGAASCLIVRRTLYPRFDECLCWMVDVDAYYRLRTATERWRLSGELKIASVLGRNDSITASIKDDLKKLEAQELSYLKQKHLAVKIWLAPNSHRILNALEGIAWVSMRVNTSVYYWLAGLFRAVLTSASSFRRK